MEQNYTINRDEKKENTCEEEGNDSNFIVGVYSINKQIIKLQVLENAQKKEVIWEMLQLILIQVMEQFVEINFPI